MMRLRQPTDAAEGSRSETMLVTVDRAESSVVTLIKTKAGGPKGQ